MHTYKHGDQAKSTSIFSLMAITNATLVLGMWNCGDTPLVQEYFVYQLYSPLHKKNFLLSFVGYY